MDKVLSSRMFRALFVALFTVLTLGFANVASLQTSSHTMAGMEGMVGHEQKSTQCQTICSSIVIADGKKLLDAIVDEAKDTSGFAAALSLANLSLLALVFIRKQVHLQCSWRPPDRTLLFGHYADGL